MKRIIALTTGVASGCFWGLITHVISGSEAWALVFGIVAAAMAVAVMAVVMADDDDF